MGTIELGKNRLLAITEDISIICEPLFRKQLFSIMNFMRLHNNGKLLYFCDNRDWLKIYLTNGYPSIGAFERTPEFKQKDHVLWDVLDDNDPIVQYSRAIFNIQYGLTIVRPFKDGYDFFNFGSSDGSRSILDNMLMAREDLDHFIDFFYEKSKKLLSDKNPFLVELNAFQSTHQNIISDKFYLGPIYHYQHLTRRELEYLHCLIQGLKVPDIASKYFLSPRTIEKHFENIKQKLNCSTQGELGYKIAKLGIIDLL